MPSPRRPNPIDSYEHHPAQLLVNGDVINDSIFFCTQSRFFCNSSSSPPLHQGFSTSNKPESIRLVLAMKRPMPWSDQVDLVSSDESSSDAEAEVDNRFGIPSSDEPPPDLSSEDMLMKRAEMYQDYMKNLAIPLQRGSAVPFTTWMELGTSIKQLYGQPLHYLTNIMLKQWDQLRFGSEDEDTPLDIVIHPCKAEATIWLVEEVHRRITSSHHIAKLWQSDPIHHAFVDPIFPNL